MTNLRASLSSSSTSDSPTLHFAGEATSQDYYGYLHGAYFEGVERGRQIAECLKDERRCAEFPVGGEFDEESKGGVGAMWKM